MLPAFINILLFSFVSFCLISPSKAIAARVAIVIDDIGYRVTDKQALQLPGDITYSILPHTPFGKRLALQANANAKDVLLHIPMEAENGKKLGPGALTSTMDEQEVLESLQDSLTEIPFAIGINNHMGSYLTQLSAPMTWTMTFLKRHHLLFLDSKTSPYSKASTIAIQQGVPVKSRHIFLDNQITPNYISHQFNLLIAQAKHEKYVIAIAHPHPETIAALQKLLPTLADNGIDLVPLSSLYSPNIQKETLVANSE